MRASESTFYQSRPGVFALATLCCLLWGSAYPAIKNGYTLLAIASDDIASQVLFAGWRFVLAGTARGALDVVRQERYAAVPVGENSTFSRAFH